MSPSGNERLIGLYFKSRELHFRVAVHESSRRRICPAGGVSACRAGRLAVGASSGDRRSQAEAFGSCHAGVRGSGTHTLDRRAILFRGGFRPRCYGTYLIPGSARLHRNAGFDHYSPNHEACHPPGGQIRQAHRHWGSAEGRCGRERLLGSPVPVRLWRRNRPAHQLAYLRRCPVLRMLAWPAQIPAKALPGLRNAGHDPA